MATNISFGRRQFSGGASASQLEDLVFDACHWSESP